MRPCIINYKGSEYIAYVSVPKDLTEVKTKALFNLTKRQLICFGSGAAIGVPLFFLCESFLNVSAAALIMIFVLLPFMLLAMYEKNGQPLEKVLHNILQTCFLRPKQRLYQTKNFYAILESWDQLDKEAEKIIDDRTTHKKRKTAKAASRHTGKGEG